MQKVFEHNKGATAPVDVTEEDPWGGRDRVNVLLLGGDGSVHRDGVRTDSVVLASMDVHTGRTVLFSLPRNLSDVPFAAGIAAARTLPGRLHRRTATRPSGCSTRSTATCPPCTRASSGSSDNEGADAVKLAVAGALGVPVDYYLLVNLAGFRSIVQAIGGVTVNINQPIPIGGNTDLGIPPDDYLQPGPNQRLDGFEALWFARGRYGSDDYQRMERQRCMIDAIIDEAKPLNLLRRYQSLAAVGQGDRPHRHPQRPAAGVRRPRRPRSRAARSGPWCSAPPSEFAPSNPDYDWVHAKVRQALRRRAAGPRSDGPPDGAERTDAPPSASPTVDPADAVDAADACAYQPVS